MRWHPAQKDRLVAACMHGGCAIVKADALADYQMQELQVYDAHESLTYDVDWIRLREEYVVASCSFYDSMLHFWQTQQIMP